MTKVFIHGLGQTSDVWNKTINGLVNKDNCLCVDLIHLVDSNEVTYLKLYYKFCEFCNRIEGKLDLCGLSLGSVLALNYAIDFPEKVNSLVLIAGQYKMPKGLLVIQNFVFHLLPKSSFEKMGFRKKDFIELCQSMSKLDFSKDIRKIQCPTLVLCGAKDGTNRKASIELTSNIKDSKIRFIEGASHEVNVDAPEQLSQLINQFWQK